MNPIRSNYSLGLLGFPLGHSLSPLLHQAALQASGLSGEYALYPVPPLPGGSRGLSALLDRLRQGELQGLNVTIPHKQSVLPLIDHVTATARSIGAVNTLYCDESGRLSGENTDAPGFLADLDRQFPAFTNKKALILGAGGAARAVVYALAKAGWQVHVAARRPDQAGTLASSFVSLCGSNITFSAMDRAALQLHSAGCSLIVNTTPSGMSPDVRANPWPADTALPAQACVYDLVYNPPETELVRTARDGGLPACNGLGMLVEQAALSFEIWTGEKVACSDLLNALPENYLHATRSLQ